MIFNKSVLVVVPARGGSKGVPLKNIRPINGVPLVALVGKVVRRLTFVDRAIVSTDHPEIANVAKDAGLDVPFFRPESLSGDFISDWDVLNHALLAIEEIDKRKYDIIVMLQPTSPLRKPEYVQETVEKLIKENLDSVWTVSETDSKNHPLKQLKIVNGKLEYYDLRGEKIVARQQLEPVYHRNGVAYAVTRECLLEQKTIKGVNTGAIIIKEEMISADTLRDFKLVEFLLREQNEETK